MQRGVVAYRAGVGLRRSDRRGRCGVDASGGERHGRGDVIGSVEYRRVDVVAGLGADDARCGTISRRRGDSAAMTALGMEARA